MQELALAHDLEPVISDLESICKAIRDLKELSGALVRSDIADRLVAETDILKAQKTLRHDLRTPINAIKGYGEMLLEDLQDFQAEIIRPNLLRLLDDSTALSGRIYEIVDLGAVEPPEEPDKGTIVGSERVMVSTSPISEAHKGPFSGRRALVPGKVLVVDDVEANRDILRERLTRQGHNVTVTEDGISALRLLREEEFELVLLDVMMPGMDGFEVLARIKSDDNLRDVPVIMVSALDEMDSVIRCIELGAEDYLPKSFDPVLLRARVNACLEKKKWADRERTHVKRLAAAMKQVQDRDLSVTLDDSGEDVYAEVYRGFNLMTEELRDEAEILELAHDLSGEIEIEALIDKFVHSTSSLLDAERGVFYLYDQKTDELRARVVAQGRTQEIKLAADAGLVGAVFQSGDAVNLKEASDHPSFSGLVDKILGGTSHSVLAMPVITKEGETIGVTQVVNKRGGDTFTAQDEARLSAFCAQIAFTLYNAQLFEEVVQIKNYNENILKSTSASLITLDREGTVVTANERADALFGEQMVPLVGKEAVELFGGAGDWVLESISRTKRIGRAETELDTSLPLPNRRTASVNLTVAPLRDGNDNTIGSMLSIEDVTREKRMRSTMTRYMSKEVVDQLLDGGESALGGKSNQATILFSDISGFTLLSEAMGPQDTVRMLNDYFAEMVDVLFERAGILDKYIGDALMALFGVPFEKPTDPDNAIAAALEMLVALDRLNERRARTGHAAIRIRIGINTGNVIAGNIGSPRRMEYTVIGDSVNLAARLEAANKFYETNILVGEYTVNNLQKSILMREIDLIRVPGKDKPVAIFEPLAYHNSVTSPALDQLLVPYQRGLEAYRRRDWDGAISYFENALAVNARDRPSQIYMQRSVKYKETPPSERWDGVFDLADR